ncbi:MAG: glycosyltransferase family 39 protein [Desulfobaccales bacterium]
MIPKQPGPKLPSPPAKSFPLPSLVFASKESPVIKRWIGPAVITLVFLILSFWTWRKWPDLLIDFGRELYMPWQINSGKVLYKDLAYWNGPLAPYLNALWFRIFGVSFTTLVYCNLAIIIAICSIIFSLIKRSCDRTTAVMACIVFLCTAAFPQFIEMGSFNFVSPYDHSVTHAILFSFILIYCLSSYLRAPRHVMLVLAGFSCGLVFLTKAEIFVPLAITAFVGLMLIYHRNKAVGWNAYKIFLIFTVSMMIPIALFLAYFSSVMPFGQAVKGVLGNWAVMYNTHMTDIYFYKKKMGTDKPMLSVVLMSLSFIVLSIITLGALKLDKSDFKKHYNNLILVGIILLFIVLPVLNFGADTLRVISTFLFALVYRPILLITILSLCLVSYFILKKKDYVIFEKMSPFIMLNVFAILTLGKMILNCRADDYGFVLAMTAMLIDVAFFVWLIPLLLRQEYARGNLFRQLAILGCALISIYALIMSNYYYSKKDYWVGQGADAFLSYGPGYDPKAWVVNKAIERIKETTSPNDNFTPIPEGLIINYLMRRPSPFPLDAITPGWLIMIGETATLDSLKDAHPKFILLIPRETKEFGVGSFGSDKRNGKMIMDWITNHYTYVWQIPKEPLKDGKFVITMLKRID